MKSKIVDNQPQKVTDYPEIDPKEQDEAINSIAPMWDGNETWRLSFATKKQIYGDAGRILPDWSYINTYWSLSIHMSILIRKSSCAVLLYIRTKSTRFRVNSFGTGG